MKFSIIIPAYNEEKEIGATINSLLKLKTSRKDFEIVVADNNSTDKTSVVAKKAGADKVVLETTKGTNFAREAGRKVAKGKIVAFLDADSIVPVDWLSHIERNLGLPGVVATSGPYDYGWSGLKKAADSLYTSFILPSVPSILVFVFRKKTGVIIEGNFAVTAEALKKTGGLPPVAFWGDGSAICKRIAGHAGKIFFDPTLMVKSSPERFRKKGFFRLTLRYAWEYLKMYFSDKYD